MTTIEWLYIHLLIIGSALTVFGIMRLAVRALAADVRARAEAQKRANVWLADQIALVASRPPATVHPMRRPDPNGGR